MHQAEMTVIAAVQREAFPKDLKRKIYLVKLLTFFTVQKLNPIYTAQLCFESEVGYAMLLLDFDAKHPIIMPANSQVTRLLIERCHKDVGHNGSSHTWSVLRERYGAATVRKILGAATVHLVNNIWLTWHHA